MPFVVTFDSQQPIACNLYIFTFSLLIKFSVTCNFTFDKVHLLSELLFKKICMDLGKKIKIQPFRAGVAYSSLWNTYISDEAFGVVTCMWR